MNIKSIIFLLAALICTADCFARELKITNKQGLVLAVKNIQDSGQVVVKYQPVEEDSSGFVLKNQSGLATDLFGVESQHGVVVFSGVLPGVWQLVDSQNKVFIKGVRIKKRQ